MYPISDAVKALFETEQRQVLRISFADKRNVNTVSGNNVTIDDGAALPVSDMKVAIEPVQDLHGYDHPWPAGGGKNLVPYLENTNTQGNVSYTLNANGSVTVNTNGQASGIVNRAFPYITLPAGNYIISGCPANGAENTYRADVRKSSGGVIRNEYGNGAEFTLNEPTEIYYNVRVASGVTLNNATFYPMIRRAGTDATYEPYSNICPITGWTGANIHVSPTQDAQDGKTYSVSFGEAGTVYGGTLDVTTGLLTVTDANIASYAGESLSGVWISSMDVYSAGATPTNGAQVVYKLSTPITYQLTPQQITLLSGTNNIWADTGDVEVSYYPIRTITDADVLMDGFNIDRYSCNGDRLEIGTAIASELTLKLDNRDGRYNGVVFEGTELFVEVGIADWTLENPEIHYIPCGYFTPDEQPRSYGTITLHALDRMMRFDEEDMFLYPWTTETGEVMTTETGEIIYFANDFILPSTIIGLVQQVCDYCNVPLAKSSSNLPNSDFLVTEFPSLQQRVTFRTVISWCAGIMGANAWIDWNGELRFSWYSNATDYVTTMANRFNSDLHENKLSVTGVIYTSIQDTTFVSGSDLYALDLTGNYLVAVGTAEILEKVNAATNGFTYLPFEATVINAPYLWPMDVITFTDRDGIPHSTVLTNVNFALNGHTEIAGKGETAQNNGRTTPTSVTGEQARLIEQVAESIVELDNSLTQEEIFDRLTNNGQAQGVYLKDGKIYINGTYMQIGTIAGASGENFWVLDGSDAEFVVKKGRIGAFILDDYSLIYESDGTSIYRIKLSGAGVRSEFYNGVSGNTGATNLYGGRVEFYWNDVNQFDITNGDEFLFVHSYVTGDSLPVEIYDSVSAIGQSIHINYDTRTYKDLEVRGDFFVSGTKSRAVSTDQYADRLLYCYETPSPMFGDVGEGVIAEDGRCFVWLDSIFAQTVTTDQYQVFLQRYGPGDCWVAERRGGYFVVEGEPGLRFGWEIKAKQRNYDQLRLERNGEKFTVPTQTYGQNAATYINELKKERISA